MQASKSICVFCGSSPGNHSMYRDAARSVGTKIGEHGYRLVYGGGSVGMMGTIADAALESGAEVIGVLPRVLVEREVAHRDLTETVIVETMSARKERMAALSDVFVTLPGGMGTLDELFEMLTWTQIGFHRKVSAILNVDGYFDPLLAFFDRAVETGFLKAKYRDQLVVEGEAGRLFDRIPDAAIMAPAEFTGDAQS